MLGGGLFEKTEGELLLRVRSLKYAPPHEKVDQQVIRQIIILYKKSCWTTIPTLSSINLAPMVLENAQLL